MEDLAVHYQKLAHLYKSANIQTAFFPEVQIKIEAGNCEIKLPVKPEWFHGGGGLHGAIVFKLLDEAAFFAAQSVEKDFFLQTASFDIHFVRPVSEGMLLAKGMLRMNGKTSLIAEAKLLSDKGKEIAFGTGHFARSKIRLSEMSRYSLI